MTKRLRTLLLVASALLMPMAIYSYAGAADHADSPSVMSDPGADINDVFVWTNADADKLNLAMTVNPDAGSSAQFSNAIQYVFHVNSSAGYGMEQTETLVMCRFPSPDRIQCWAGTEYLEGDPRSPSGVTNASQTLRIFAGLRDDPFFFELNGFKETVSAVVSAAPSLTFDDAGCPDLDEGTQMALVQQLQSGVDGAPGSNTFEGQNVLALVVQVDRSVVAVGGDVLGVWASTNVPVQQ